MKNHQFTLIVEGPDLQSDAASDALFDAGCGDALVGRADGIQYLDFDRDAESLEGAVLSAVSDIESVTGVEVVRLADAGLVSMADIAKRTGRTRESVRLLIAGERGSGDFPPPVTDPRSRYRLWRSSDVDRWFVENLGTPPIDRDDRVVAAINAGLDLRHNARFVAPESQADLRDLVGL